MKGVMQTIKAGMTGDHWSISNTKKLSWRNNGEKKQWDDIVILDNHISWYHLHLEFFVALTV